MSVHARLSPSGAARWMACAGSFPTAESAAAAREAAYREFERVSTER